MDGEDVIQIIIEELASLVGRTPADVLEELTTAGSMLPVDSLTTIEILVAVEERVGVTLPEDTASAKSLRSVRALARRFVDVAASTTAAERQGA